MSLNLKSIKLTWSKSIANKNFRSLLILGLVLFLVILVIFPLFFNFIETRKGIQLNDVVLNIFPAINLSLPIFIIIWSTAVLLIIEAIKSPKLLFGFLWGFILLSVSRIATISLVPLEAPKNLIPLIDPLSNTFYGGKFLTKDLFYSGHTATQLLIYFHFEKKWQKTCALVASFLIGIMVLIQHVHYTIDVVFAFVFVPIIYFINKKYILSKI
ncbi:MAG: phosphatase PAP2-related protein [Chitinophagaceae bacterium]|jgi:hypothetical protein